MRLDDKITHCRSLLDIVRHRERLERSRDVRTRTSYTLSLSLLFPSSIVRSFYLSLTHVPYTTIVLKRVEYCKESLRYFLPPSPLSLEKSSLLSLSFVYVPHTIILSPPPRKSTRKRERERDSAFLFCVFWGGEARREGERAGVHMSRTPSGVGLMTSA